MRNPFYLALILLTLIACSDNHPTTKITDVYSLADGENGLARQDYEYMRLRNPVTEQIPAFIQEREFNFIKQMSHPKSLTDWEWQQRGPYNVGGRTRALAIDINDENRVLAGGVSGGLWMSNDGGQSFEKVTTNLMLHSVTSIAQDPRNGFQNVWYYGTGELSGNSSDLFGHGIYKSTDNGLTWALLPATANDSANQVSSQGDFRFVQDVKVNPVNGDVIVASYTGILLSQDGGDTWQVVRTADGSPNGFGYFNFGNQVSVMVDDNGVYYAMLSSDALHAGIYRSVDGISWTDITPVGFPANFRRIEMSFDPFDLNRMLFVVDASTNPSVDNHELWHYTYLSGDGSGANGVWDDRSANLPAGTCTGFYTFDFGYFQTQNSYDMMIAYHPTVQDVVFLGGTNLYRSTDAFQSDTGYSWIGGYQCDQATPSNYIWPNHHPDNHDVKFLPSNPSVMISAHDGGLSITQDCLADNIQWQSSNNGYGTTQFYTVAIEHGNVESDVIIGGLQDNGTFMTTDLNPTEPWISTFYGDGAYCAIADNREAYYVSWQGGKTFKFDIDDNGQTQALTRIDPIGGADYLFINPFILDPSNTNTMYLAAGRYIWRNDSLADIPLLNDEYNAISQGWDRIDESSTNTQIGGINYISALGMSADSSDILYYGTFNGRVYRLSGLQTGNLVRDILNTSALPSGAYISSIIPNPNNAEEILLSYSNYEVKSIFYSNDAGETWQNISGSLEENPDGSGAGPSVNWMHWYQDDTDTLYLAGTTSGLFATKDLQGENTIWERQAIDEIGNVPVTMIDSRAYDKNIVVATHGAGIFSTKVVEVGIRDEENLTIANLGFPYPNPSNGQIQLDIQVLRETPIIVNVFDMLGRYVETVDEHTFSAGKHKLKWSTSNYNSGAYVVVLMQNNEMQGSRKFFVKH